MLAAVPAFGAVVSRLPRHRFIPLVYHFLVLNLAAFWLWLMLDVERQWAARAFFVWLSVFNLFAVSVFWSFLADLFTREQASRLFGFIAAGGSAGAILGPAIAISLAEPMGPVHLMLVAALLLEGAVLCARRLEHAAVGRGAANAEAAARAAAQRSPEQAGPVGGGWLAGIAMIVRSPYLAGIALWVCALSLAGTFLYFAQATIVAASSDDPAVRTRLFAAIDLAVSVITILVQVFATGRLIPRFGAGPAAGLTPFVFMLGFAAFALSPTLAVVIAFQALQRAANFAISNPARESFFTVVEREAKYKAKNVIDIVVFRGADAAWGWLFAALRAAGLDLAVISVAILPAVAGWLIISLALGRAQARRAESAATPERRAPTIAPAQRR
jgi:AAA family ATP:ADP antiporter